MRRVIVLVMMTMVMKMIMMTCHDREKGHHEELQ
jgi:hypothetical protein